MSEPFATGARFAPRQLPTGSAAEYLRRSMRGTRESYDLVVTFAWTSTVAGCARR